MVKHDSDSLLDHEKGFHLISDWLLPTAVFLGSFGLYFKTMAPSVFWNDSAAFATSNYILGIPHSPSFPLYTLIGRVFASIPGLEPAFAANLMSAFFASISVMLFFMLARRFVNVPAFQMGDYKKVMADRKMLLRRPDLKRDDRLIDIESLSQPPVSAILPVFAVTVLFAVTLPLWLSAVRAEVYSLHLVLTFGAILFCLKGRGREIKKQKLFWVGIWMYALSFANHPLLALAFGPAFLFLLIRQLTEVGYKAAFIASTILMFILSFSVYFYLPIRAALEPVINWGRPDTWDSFWAAITRSSDLANLSGITFEPDYILRLRKLGYFMSTQIGWPLVFIWLVTFWGIYRISKRGFPFLILAIAGNLAVCLWAADFSERNYDMISYLAPLTALILLVGVTGLFYMLRRRIIAGHSAVYVTLFVCIFAFVAAQENFARADLSGVTAPDIVTSGALEDIPEGSILIAAEDDLLLPLWYRTYCDSLASGIKVMAAGAMANPAYRKQLTVNYPDLNYPAGFTNDLPGDPAKLALDICRFNEQERDIYMQIGVPGIDFKYLKPHGILFKYTGNNPPGKIDRSVSLTHMVLADQLISPNPMETRTIDFTGRWLFNTGVYFERHGYHREAWQLFHAALEIDKTSVDMRIRLAVALANAGRYQDALLYISRALEIDHRNANALKLGTALAKKINPEQMADYND